MILPRLVSRLALPLAAGLLLGGARSAEAQRALAASVEAPILLRVLAFDRALDRNGRGDLVVAVLYDAASTASTQAKEESVRALRGAGIPTVLGRVVKVVELNVAAGSVSDQLRRQGVAAAYLTPGMPGRVGEVVAAAAAGKVMTLAGNRAYIRQGVAVGVDTLAGHPQLYVNLPAARAAGADLSSALLKLATVTQ